MPKKTIKKQNNIKAQIEKALDKIRPGLAMDGGDVQLVGVDEAEGVAKVRLIGACQHCPMATQTLQYVVEEAIKKNVKAIKKIIAV
jgi:Fe-S cluster biogenesis protein NfuA